MKPFETNEMLIAVDNALRRRELEIENRAHQQHLELLVAERTADLTATVERLSLAERHCEPRRRRPSDASPRRSSFATPPRARISTG